MPPPAEAVTVTPKPLVTRRTKPATTPTQRRAAQNFLDALGGPDVVVPKLRATGDKRAQQLADMMMSADFDRASFYFKLKSVGLPLTQFTELLLDVNHASAIARLVMSADRVAEDILSKAVDQIVEHRACLASGHVLHETEDGTIVPTEYECFDCQGSGYVLKSAEKEWVDLYLELVKLRKNAPMVAISNTRNAWQQNVNVYGDLTTPDGAPMIESIIKRVDEQRLPSRQLTDGSERLSDVVGADNAAEMPEDAVVEAEVVESTSV